VSRPVLPVEGQSGPGQPWAATLNNAIIDVSDRADQAISLAQANASGGVPGVVQLDSFVGATDDAKLDAALSYAGAQTRIPAIQFSNRLTTLNTVGRIPFNGMKLIGPGGSAGPKNLELNSGKYVTHQVRLNVGNGTSSWFNGTGSIYDVYIGDLAFQGGGSVAQFWHQASGTLYACQFHALTHYNFKHVFGTPAAKALMTQVVFSGHWTCLNFWDTPFTIGGSDNNFWMSGYINMGPSQSDQQVGGGKFQFSFDGVGKTNVGYMYVSCNNGWRGIRISGNSGNALNFYGGMYEGYKPSGVQANGQSLRCDGSLIRVEGGGNAFFGPWIAFGMDKPDANNHGLVEILGGDTAFYRPTFALGATPESTPMVYASGGTVTVRDAAPATLNSTWTQAPLVTAAGGTIRSDDSVRTS